MPLTSDALRSGGRVSERAGEVLRRRALPIVVFLGFALLFALWLITQFSILKGINDVEARASRINLRFGRAEELLTTVRLQAQLASIYLRDALLDPVASNAPEHRRQVEDAQQRVNEALSEYAPLGDSASERSTLEQLRQGTRDYWDTMVPVLTLNSTGHSSQARDLLFQGGVPRREAISRISDRIRELNREAFIQERADVARVYRVQELRIWQTSAIALICGLLIAAAVTFHAGRLESRVREQLARNAESARNLQRLSARLVKVQEEERRIIARELHDEIGQALTAIKLELRSAQRRAEETGQLGNLLDVAQGCADDAIHTVRDLSQLLHPSLLDHLGLPAALQWSLRAFSERTGIRAELTTDGVDERFAPELETCLYRIAQEGLTNVARHAEARMCRVRLQRLRHALVMTVEDDGKGFDAQQLQAEHANPGLGLLGVQERVFGFGGTFRLDTAVGRGTRLTVELPGLHRASVDGDNRQTAATSGQEEDIS